MGDPAAIETLQLRRELQAQKEATDLLARTLAAQQMAAQQAAAAAPGDRPWDRATKPPVFSSDSMDNNCRWIENYERQWIVWCGLNGRSVEESGGELFMNLGGRALSEVNKQL